MYPDNMTIHYFKSSGEIYVVATGEQHISIYYGEHSADFEIILDEIIIPLDEYVLHNSSKFKVNTITKQLEIKPETAPQYPVAAQ